MKRFTLSLIAACAVALGAASAQGAAPKLAHLNTGIILESLPETAVADSLLGLYQDSLRMGFADLETQLGEVIGKLRDPEARDNMTGKQVADLEREAQSLQEQAQVYQTEGARMFEARRAQYLGPIVDRVGATIESYAKANGYNLVFDTSVGGVLVFAEEGKDITQAVIDALRGS